MRPRGLSSSSPNNKYVGQVAVQKPQWTQVRRIFSDSATSASASCASVKLVCTSDALEHAAGIEHALRIERALHFLGQRLRSVGFENLGLAAFRFGRAHQGRVTAATLEGPPHL